MQTSQPTFTKVILRKIGVQITFETRKRNTGLYTLRQGVSQGRSSEGYPSIKQVMPWPSPWHVDFFFFFKAKLKTVLFLHYFHPS